MILSKISMLKFLVVLYPHDDLSYLRVSFLFRVPSRLSAGDYFSLSLFLRYSNNELLSKLHSSQGRGVLPRSYAKERGEEFCISSHDFKQEFSFSEVFISTSPYDILKCRCISFLFRVSSRLSAGGYSSFFSLIF